MIRSLVLSLALAAAVPAAAQVPPAAASDCPRIENFTCIVPVHMRRGTDTIVFRGRLTHQHSGYSYRFKARAGQVLTWSVDGPATREVIGYPDGDGDGPGIPDRIELKQTGEYTFSVSANLMAEGGFGPFTLRLTIK